MSHMLLFYSASSFQLSAAAQTPCLLFYFDESLATIGHKLMMNYLSPGESWPERQQP
jgi:hypothetical protein